MLMTSSLNLDCLASYINHQTHRLYENFLSCSGVPLIEDNAYTLRGFWDLEKSRCAKFALVGL